MTLRTIWTAAALPVTNWFIEDGKAKTTTYTHFFGPKRSEWAFAGWSDVRCELDSDGEVGIAWGDESMVFVFNFATGKVLMKSQGENYSHESDFPTGGPINVRMCYTSLWVNDAPIYSLPSNGTANFNCPTFVLMSGSYATVDNFEAFATAQPQNMPFGANVLFPPDCPECQGCVGWPVGPKPTALQVTIAAGKPDLLNDGTYILDPTEDNPCIFATDATVRIGAVGMRMVIPLHVLFPVPDPGIDETYGAEIVDNTNLTFPQAFMGKIDAEHFVPDGWATVEALYA